jgi:DNA-binding Xre family transcriptional regulator
VVDYAHMIVWRVRDVAERAGIRTAYELWKYADIHPKTAYNLWNGTATRVDVQTLEKLCLAFQVPVGQLIQHVDSPAER